MRKPRNFDAELKALEDRARVIKVQRITQFGEIVESTGADALPLDALAGLLLAAMGQSKDNPEMVARWSERGAAFFQGGRKAAGTKTADSNPPGAAEF